MKRSTLIILLVSGVAATGFFAWKQQHSCYNMKMAMVCEHSCAAKNSDATRPVTESRAKAGDYTICPVSGVLFLVTTATNKVKSGGKSAITCCATCASLFAEDPAAYSENIN